MTDITADIEKGEFDADESAVLYAETVSYTHLVNIVRNAVFTDSGDVLCMDCLLYTSRCV